MILLTGSSGFLGTTIRQQDYSNELLTLGRGSNSHIICDLQSQIPSLPALDLVIHAAGKAHCVPRTESERQAFFDVNVMGTNNLLHALEKGEDMPRAFVFISTVAVYGLESGTLVTEAAPLLAKDPYGLSKVEAEKNVKDWCLKNGVICTILRLPLLAGPNPPGNLRSMIKGIKNGYYFNVEGGNARKSIVLAKDVAQVIPKISSVGGTYNLTDGYHPSFIELSKTIASQLNRNDPLNLPKFVVKVIGRLGDVIGSSFINSGKLTKMTYDLTFSDIKARQAFGWNPRGVLKDFEI